MHGKAYDQEGIGQDAECQPESREDQAHCGVRLRYAAFSVPFLLLPESSSDIVNIYPGILELAHRDTRDVQQN